MACGKPVGTDYSAGRARAVCSMWLRSQDQLTVADCSRRGLSRLVLTFQESEKKYILDYGTFVLFPWL